ncbi:MAG: sensor histidine kinase [Lachnospiraceae bacterium]|nr:sensor histidine kinase [Lachnospiraceae bacterium]
MKHEPWRLAGFLSKKKIRTQLFSVYFVAVFVPILVVGIYLTSYVSRLLNNYYQESIQAESTRVRTLFSELTTQLYKKTTDILFDEEIIRILTTTEYPTEKVNTSSYYNVELNQLIRSNVEIEDITIYTDNSYAADYLHFAEITPELEQTDWLRRARESSVSFWTTIERVDANGNSHWNLCLVRRVPGTDSTNPAVMVVSMDDVYLQGRINSKKYGIRIITENNKVCFSSAYRDYGQSVNLDIDFDNNYFVQNDSYWLNGKKVYYNISALNMYQTASNTYIMSTSDSAYYEIRKITMTCALIALAAMLLPLVLILFFTGYFSNRVTTLRREMKKVSNEEYDILPDFHGEDELSEVFSDLQIMVQNIKEKDAKVYSAQLRDQQLQNEQQKMEMKMLASQINPHFLYNTLESIRMQALTSGNRNVANSIKLLGKSMRYVLENTGTGFITLMKEMEYIETYLQIQKLRFGDRVNFEIAVEPQLVVQDQKILPFLLQPVIENAIVHGLEEITENGHIRIDIEQDGEFLVATISDNGVGMNGEELSKLREKIRKNTLNASNSIGLGNIDRRIKLCYGKEYGLQIQSTKGEGTRVILRLPMEIEAV